MPHFSYPVLPSFLFSPTLSVKPTLIEIALFTRSIVPLSNLPTYSFNRLLSTVRICSNSTMESFSNMSSVISICVGSFALFCLLVIAATIVVGLYLLPVSFCITSTGRTPPCSLPTTGLKSAYYISFLFISFIILSVK